MNRKGFSFYLSHEIVKPCACFIANETNQNWIWNVLESISKWITEQKKIYIAEHLLKHMIMYSKKRYQQKNFLIYRNIQYISLNVINGKGNLQQSKVVCDMFKNNSQNGSHHFTSLVTTVCSFVPICTVAHAGRCFVKIVEIRINQNNTTK